MQQGVRAGGGAKAWEGAVDEVGRELAEGDVQGEGWGSEICQEGEENFPDSKHLQPGVGFISKRIIKEVEECACVIGKS